MRLPKIKTSPKTALPSLLPMVTFTVCYMAIASVRAVWVHNWEFLLYIAGIVALGTLLFTVRLYSSISPRLFWGLSFWGILHLLGGLTHIPLDLPIESGGKHVLYSLWILPPHLLKYDNIVHFYGSFLLTIVMWQALRGALENITPRFGVLILCILGTLGLGSINEIGEYILTLFVKNTNVGGYDNTMWDLMWNGIGATSAAIALRVHVRHRKSPSSAWHSLLW